MESPQAFGEDFIPPPEVFVPKVYEAGDILPTFVTPEDAKKYLGEVATNYQQLDIDIARSTVSQEFKGKWVVQFMGWKGFYNSSVNTVGWFNAKAVMDQTDRYAASLSDWRKTFVSMGGKVIGPDPVKPGQGTGPEINPIAIITSLTLLAGVVILGPPIVKAISNDY